MTCCGGLGSSAGLSGTMICSVAPGFRSRDWSPVPGPGLAPGDLNDYKIKFPLGHVALHSILQIRTCKSCLDERPPRFSFLYVPVILQAPHTVLKSERCFWKNKMLKNTINRRKVVNGDLRASSVLRLSFWPLRLCWGLNSEACRFLWSRKRLVNFSSCRSMCFLLSRAKLFSWSQ